MSRQLGILGLLVVLLELAVTASAPLFADAISFRLTAPKGVRQLLIRMPVPDEIAERLKKQPHWTVRVMDAEQRRPVQLIETRQGLVAVWRPAAPLSVESVESVVLEPVESRPAARFEVESTAAGLVVRHGGQLLLTYHDKTTPLPAGVDPIFARSGFVHPLLTPAGQIVTDDLAPDHRHQHGLFSAWVKTRIEGVTVDFWNQGKGEGTVEHRRTVLASGGAVTAILETELAHVQFLADKSARDVLTEDWQLLLHQTDGMCVWEWCTRQVNVGNAPVRLEQHHYGGYAIRGAREWSLPAQTPLVDITTNAAENRVKGNHTSARWVQMSGLLAAASEEKQPAAVALIGAADNPRSPQTVRLHPSKPYFCFCPVVEKAVELPPGGSLQNRFLVVTADRPLTTEELLQLAEEFDHPPQIDWQLP